MDVDGIRPAALTKAGYVALLPDLFYRYGPMAQRFERALDELTSAIAPRPTPRRTAR